MKRVSQLTVEVIQNVEHLMALEPFWNQVLIKSGRPTVYLTYEWLSSWWKCHGNNGKTLFVLKVTDGSEILGIAPFMEVSNRFSGLPIRKIEFISMMDYANSPNNLSGSLDVIVADRHDEVFEAITSYLIDRKIQWHFLRLHPISADSQLLVHLEKEARERGIPFEKKVVFSNACIHIEGEEKKNVLQQLTKHRKKFNNLEQKLKQQGEIKYVEYNSLAEVSYEDILDIEKRSWKWNTGVSINSIVYGDFYRLFAEEASKKGWFRLWLLEINGEKIAYDYNTEFAGSVETLKGSYDMTYNKYSPGVLLTWREVEYFSNNGIKRINLLWGDIKAKQRWVPTIELHYEVFVFNDTIASRFIHFLYFKLLLYGRFRFVSDLRKRILRKLGIHSRTSELTRSDQVLECR
jgi:CelD/BcsL family acetyltransferase involved in cellulose biosynthesis